MFEELNMTRKLKRRLGRAISVVLSVAMLVTGVPADLLGGIASVKAIEPTEPEQNTYILTTAQNDTVSSGNPYFTLNDATADTSAKTIVLDGSNSKLTGRYKISAGGTSSSKSISFDVAKGTTAHIDAWVMANSSTDNSAVALYDASAKNGIVGTAVDAYPSQHGLYFENGNSSTYEWGKDKNPITTTLSQDGLQGGHTYYLAAPSSVAAGMAVLYVRVVETEVLGDGDPTVTPGDVTPGDVTPGDPNEGSHDGIDAGTYHFGENYKSTEAVEAIKGLSLSEGLVWHDGQHGLNTTANKDNSITLKLDQEAKITIVQCDAYGTPKEVQSTSGNVSVLTKTSSSDGVEYVISGASGETKITFVDDQKESYIHSLKVEYDVVEEPDDPTDTNDGEDVFVVKNRDLNKGDVYDFGLAQWDGYNNILTTAILNAAQNGEAGKSGATIASFTVKDGDGKAFMKFNDGGSSKTHRLRLSEASTTLAYYDATQKRYDADNKDYLFPGFLYSNVGKPDVSLEFALQEGDILTVWAGANSSGDHTYVLKNVDDESDKQEITTDIDSSYFYKMTFYAAKTGNYQLYSADEKMVVGRVQVDHTKKVPVTGTITNDGDKQPEGTKLLFTNLQSGAKTEADIAANSTYSAQLNDGYTYKVSLLNANGWVVSEGADFSIDLGAASKENDITIKKVTLVTVKGKITVSGKTAKGELVQKDVLEKATLVAESQDEGTIYVPESSINAEEGTYEIQLQSGINYILSVEGANDYEIRDNKWKYTANKDNVAIALTAKPIYAVTVKAVDVAEDDKDITSELSGATFTFTNFDDEYVYEFTGTNAINLRDGVYSVKVTNSGRYVQKLTSNVTVEGKAVTKLIKFDGKVTVWDFSSSDWMEDAAYRTAGPGEYKGLKFENAYTEGPNKPHMVATSGKVSVPVKGDCNVIVTAYYQYSFYFKNEDEASVGVKTSSTSQFDKFTYKYTGEEGTVDINIKGTSFLTKIEVVPVVEYKETITVNPDGTGDYKTINEALAAVKAMERADGTVGDTKWVLQLPSTETTNKDISGVEDFEGLKLDATGGKISLRPQQWAQFNTGAKISVPVAGPCDIIVKAYSNTEYTVNGGDPITGNQTEQTYTYTGAAGYVDIVSNSASGYIDTIETKHVDTSLASSGPKRVTISIAPADYEEMLVIDVPNVTLKNASDTPSIKLKNKGVDTDGDAVRITSYYGTGYTYYSMGSDCKWSEEVLETNKENGYPSFENPGDGTTSGSYWNATVTVLASGFEANGIIFENSFNQYVSKKAEADVIVARSGAKEGAVARADMKYGDTTVQDKAYVERAAALAIGNNQEKIYFENCKFIGRQDTLYGGTGVSAAFYNSKINGGTDYIFGGMAAVFAKCDLVFNTSDNSNDVGYITATQTGANGATNRGYLMYNCHVTSTVPGVDTASTYASKAGYLGRVWQGGTGEAVFYATLIDPTCEQYFSSTPSLIHPIGWPGGLGGESKYVVEYDTYELAMDVNTGKPVDNGKARATWSGGYWKMSELEQKATTDGEDAKARYEEAVTKTNPATYLGDWDAFAGKDMNVKVPKEDDIKDNTPIAEAKIKVLANLGEDENNKGKGSLLVSWDNAKLNAADKYELVVTLKGEEVFSKTVDNTGSGVSEVKIENLTINTTYEVSLTALRGTDRGKTDTQTKKVTKKAEVEMDPTYYLDEYFKLEEGLVINKTYPGGFSVMENMPRWGKKEASTKKAGGIEYAYWVQGSVNGPGSGGIPTGTVAALVLDALADGDVMFACAPGDGKTFHFVDGTDGTDLGILYETVNDNSSGDGIFRFAVEKGHKYYFYASGSKIMLCSAYVKYKGMVTPPLTEEPGPSVPDEVPEEGLYVYMEETEFDYTGKAIKPAIQVYNNQKLLTEGVDYTVKYKNNVKAGESAILRSLLPSP